MTGLRKHSIKILVFSGFAVAAASLIYVVLNSRNIDDRTRDWVVRSLTERFDSTVELESIHVSAFPEMSVTGNGLTIHYRNRSELPPMFRVEQFTFHLGVLGIFRAPTHIQGLHLDHMTITIAPRGSAAAKPAEPTNHNRKPLPRIVIDKLACDDTMLLILSKTPGKEPLDFAIHDLMLDSVGAGRPFAFVGTLTNAKPVGEIATKGNFGPWMVEEPGTTPVEGSYTFTNADLGPFPGIAGVLSSTGKYSGQLAELEVTGVTDTPDFSLDRVGKPVPLHTEYSATVDGITGDTYLHPVRATLAHSVFVANGSVVKSPERNGHVVSMDVTAQNARLEDVLALATKAEKPFMTGALALKTKLLLPPGKVKVVNKMKLDGQFTVTDARWASAEIRDKLQAFSRHAEGEPNNERAGSAVSGLHGHFRLDNGIVTFQDLQFSVPGADVELAGTFKVIGEELNFKGNLRTKAKLSQMMTGKASFFLKAIDPFFQKQGAGAVIPISITGTRDQPTIGVMVFHKTLKKSLGATSKKSAIDK